MSLGLPWTDAVPLGPDAGALVVDPSPLLREAPAARPRALCVLDLDLPEVGPETAGRGGDPGRGLELLPTLRTEGRPVTVVLTAVTDPGIASNLAQGLTRTGADEAVGELSARERDILRLVADGYTNKEIGEKVDLSALTVKSHLARIARTLGTGDRAQMVAVGLRSGVIS
jgi:DNA-binding CsgD family transcriptional regulator